jgi:hypothetical protein
MGFLDLRVDAMVSIASREAVSPQASLNTSTTNTHDTTLSNADCSSERKDVCR